VTGLGRQRADAAGQQLTPVPGLSSTAAAGLARQITPGQWRAVEGSLGCDRADAGAAARATGSRADRPAGHDRPGHHRRGGVREEETRGGL